MFCIFTYFNGLCKGVCGSIQGNCYIGGNEFSKLGLSSLFSLYVSSLTDLILEEKKQSWLLMLLKNRMVLKLILWTVSVVEVILGIGKQHYAICEWILIVQINVSYVVIIKAENNLIHEMQHSWFAFTFQFYNYFWWFI